MAHALTRRYPKVLLDADVLYAESEHLLTSAGTASKPVYLRVTDR